MWHKEIKGTIFGSLNPRARHPEPAARPLPRGPASSWTSSSPAATRLDDINDGYQDMRDGNEHPRRRRHVLLTRSRPAGPAAAGGSSGGAGSWRSSSPRSPPAATSCWRARPGRASRRCCGPWPTSCGIGFEFVEGNAELTPARLVGHFDPARVLAEGYAPDIFVDGPAHRGAARRLAALRRGDQPDPRGDAQRPHHGDERGRAARAPPRSRGGLARFPAGGGHEPVRRRRHGPHLRVRCTTARAGC